ncbi:MAG TPA: hypothetical protein GXZ77_01780 [Papillibacter sp.]|jgi:hypothetical protein|nr:hypothetical protein [Papillibacter sp.]
MGKYDDLVFTIPKEFHSWYGFASPRGFFRGTTMMDKAKIYLDFTSVTNELVMEVPHVHHAVDEYIVLATADFNNFYDGFDAEIDIWLGEDPQHLELVTITKPAIIRIPPKLYHCPINFRRIGKPVLFSAMYCDGDWSKITPRLTEDGREEFQYDGAGIRRCVKDRSKECIYCGACFSEAMKEFAEKMKEEQKSGDRNADLLAPYYEMNKLPRTGKYDKYVHYFSPEYHEDDRFLSPRTGFRGVEEMSESRLWTLMNIVQKACEVGELHTHHAVEEYLFFTGADVTHFFDFDAEIEIAIGEDPDNLETYTITEPTVIRIPPKMWHGPVKFKRVGGPVNFMPFYPNGHYGRIVRETREDGTPAYIYKGGDLPR